MTTTVSQDIISWSKSLSPWKQDALRRLALSSQIGASDQDELIDQIRVEAGLSIKLSAPTTSVPLLVSHISSATTQGTIAIKAITDVQSVNQLTPAAELKFQPHGLTVIYGTNGSGKSGFVRIFRSACRSRIQDAKKLKILSDVYGSSSAPQSAKIIIENNKTEETVHWSEASVPESSLQQVAVFDSQSAQIYIDAGNQIQFLPLGLDLPLRFNSLCLALRDKLKVDADGVFMQLSIESVSFREIRETVSQKFYNELSEKTTDDEIEAACSAKDSDKTQLQTLSEGLASAENAVKVQKAINVKVTTWANDSKRLWDALNDSMVETMTAAIKKAISTREAATVSAQSDLSKEPLKGVGSETWRVLWEAAKQYSINEAYVGKEFPVLQISDNRANCVLCQQELELEATKRMSRFNDFMDSTLETAAVESENTLSELLIKLPTMGSFVAADFNDRLEGVDENIADKIRAFIDSAQKRLIAIKEALSNKSPELLAKDKLPIITNLAPDLLALSKSAQDRVKELEGASDPEQKSKLIHRCNELSDLITLTKNMDTLIKRRDLLKAQKSYDVALASLRTTGTTRKAAELIDKHVTASVIACFEKEQKFLNVDHLKISLAKKTSNQNAEFKTDPGTTLTKKTSEILSEGEQRALALAAFFTEIEITLGDGPIIIDDPVSSLDRERGKLVANRIIEEAKSRQVIIFTHDIIFCNQLFASAHMASVDVQGHSIFRDQSHSGKVDPNGFPWKGLAVSKRIGKMKDRFNNKKNVAVDSPSEWEIIVRSLYGNLRDTYERMVEEDIFYQVIQRGVDAVQTQRLRRVKLSDECAVEFHKNTTKISAYCHDNPEVDSIPIPTPQDFQEDLTAFVTLRTKILEEGKLTEAARPSMKNK